MPGTSAEAKPVATPAPSSRSGAAAGQAFLGLIDPILVAPDGAFVFDGALARDHADHIWLWMTRDLAPDLVGAKAPGGAPADAQQLTAVLPSLLDRVKSTLATATSGFEEGRRLRAQMGGEEVFARLPVALAALRHRALLEKAQVFGRAVNSIADDATLGTALQGMPLSDATAAALLMQAAIGQVSNPSRLTTTVIRIAGASSEAAVQRAGFAPLVDALLSHAQSQVPLLEANGAFVDIDLTCRALDRYHRLVRAVSGYIELSRGSRWSAVIAGLTKSASDRIEPKLREVAIDVNQALRRREANDRFDSDRVLAAINGLYLLSTVRDCRDSLALNAIFEQNWNQVGQALEVQVKRNLDLFRANPADKVAASRLDAGIKMAELRYNAEYADVLKRARDAAKRAAATS
jgi:hypothetical protein